MTHDMRQLLPVKSYLYFNVLSRSVWFILPNWWVLVLIFKYEKHLSATCHKKKYGSEKWRSKCCFLLQQNWPFGNSPLLHAKTALKYLLRTVFRIRILYTIAEIHRFFENDLIWYTLYHRPSIVKNQRFQWDRNNQVLLNFHNRYWADCWGGEILESR